MSFFFGFVLQAAIIALSSAQLQCPDNSSFFDFDACDPSRRSQCPAGFACRRGSSVSDPNGVAWLCCDSVVMTIGDWFEEAELSPQVIPQVPMSQLAGIRLADLALNTPAPEVHIGDEIITLTFPDFTTAIANGLITQQNMEGGGFVHSFTIINPKTRPWALFASVNMQWPGGQFVDLTAARRNQGVFFTHIDNGTVKPEISYRSQYVVLLFRTTAPISTTMQEEIAACANASEIFTKSSVRTMGTPVAGSFFYLTTSRSLFAVGIPPQLNGGIGEGPLLVAVASLILLLLR